MDANFKTENEGMIEIFHENLNQRSYTYIRQNRLQDKGGHILIVKGSIQQEDIHL